MKRLALVGILAGLVAGCPSAHSIVRSCDEAASAPDGTPCEGFTLCSPGVLCGRAFLCSGGTLTHLANGLACDGGAIDSGSGDAASRDGGHDAGTVDAGPCAPHAPVTGTGCHVSSECSPSRFEMCFAPGASTGCGPCVPALRTCASDGDCPSTDRCDSYVDPCTRVGFCGTGSDPTSTRCVPRCTVDPSTGASSCGPGDQCETDGRCTPIPCIAGYVCPSHTTCHDVAGGDAHGCVRNACAFDADCGCGGACLSGSCYDTLGSCMSPAA